MRPSYGDFILEQERKERRKRRTVIIAVAVMLLLIIVVVVAAYFLKKEPFSVEGVLVNMGNEKQEVFYTQAELDSILEEAIAHAKVEASADALGQLKEQLLSGKSAVEAFRAVYTDDLVIAADGRYHFIPITDELKHNDYLTENLQILETGEYQYVENGQVTSHKGIDVSRFQGDINWNTVAADGVEFAFIRVGNRGYGSGAIVEDANFEKNIEGATAAGVHVGVYFFSQAINEEEVLEEVAFVLEHIAPYNVDCPIVFDMEMIAGDEGRADSLTPEQRTHLMKVFCDAIINAGHKPMIYMNLELASIRVNLAELEGYDKWFAYYNPEMYFPYEYKVWQYSESGTVAGVPELVDVNICFEPIW